MKRRRLIIRQTRIKKLKPETSNFPMKIICVGRNYAEHAKEMHHDIPDKPVVFMKPDTALKRKNLPFFLPDFSNEVHYETEIVLRISKNGKNIEEQFARNYFDQLTV